MTPCSRGLLACSSASRAHGLSSTWMISTYNSSLSTLRGSMTAGSSALSVGVAAATGPVPSSRCACSYSSAQSDDSASRSCTLSTGSSSPSLLGSTEDALRLRVSLPLATASTPLRRLTLSACCCSTRVNQATNAGCWVCQGSTTGCTGSASCWLSWSSSGEYQGGICSWWVMGRLASPLLPSSHCRRCVMPGLCMLPFSDSRLERHCLRLRPVCRLSVSLLVTACVSVELDGPEAAEPAAETTAVPRCLLPCRASWDGHSRCGTGVTGTAPSGREGRGGGA
jgi:hypothetical protein